MAGAQVSVLFTGDELKLLKAQMRVNAEQQKMETGFKRTGRTAKKTGRDVEQSFGGQVAGGVLKAAAAVATLDTARRAVSAGFAQLKKEVEGALGSLDRLDDPSRSLAQVATSSNGLTQSEDLTQMMDRANAAAVAHGISRDAAMRVFFSARSEGFEKDFESIMAASPLIDPEAAAGVAGQMPTLFKNSNLTGMQAINANLAAAQASRLNFEQMASAFPAAAAGAAPLGSTPEETLAALSSLASLTKSGDIAATQIGTFSSKAQLNEATKDQGLLEAVRIVERMSEANRSSFLGQSKEMHESFNNLSQSMAEIENRRENISIAIGATGTADSPVSEGVRARLSQAGVRQAIDNRSSEIEREIATEKRALDNIGRDAGLNRAMVTTLNDPRSGVLDRTIQDWLAPMAAQWVPPQQAQYLGESFGRLPLPPLTMMAEGFDPIASRVNMRSRMREPMADAANIVGFENLEAYFRSDQQNADKTLQLLGEIRDGLRGTTQQNPDADR